MFSSRTTRTVPDLGPDDLLALHRLDAQRYPFLLQSVAGAGALARFDILFTDCGDTLQLNGNRSLSGNIAPGETTFLAALDNAWQRERAARVASDLPFTGGWFLYLGYELAQEIEPALDLRVDPVLPTAVAVRCHAAVIVDRESGAAHYVSERESDDGFAQLSEDLAQARTLDAPMPRELPAPAEESPEVFIEAVEQARRYIAAGDVYQANLSREWTAHADTPLDAVQVYERLCASNPAPFAGLAKLGEASIVSSSPERLVASRNGWVSTRPIAGTRPRASNSNEDVSLSDELFAHPKERAEHIMLVDLERNDLGRVCEAGTVEVDEMMVLESYAHVHHIVSNVRGRLRSEVSPADVIRAVFPGGTITGCPKVRCMQIIRELENSARGAYTGSFGYLNLDGSLDLNILIRTMVIHDRTLSFRAGSGIVADSVARKELAETRAKAEGLSRALGQ